MNPYIIEKYIKDSDNEIKAIMSSDLPLTKQRVKISKIRVRQTLIKKQYLNPEIEKQQSRTLSDQADRDNSDYNYAK